MSVTKTCINCGNRDSAVACVSCAAVKNEQGEHEPSNWEAIGEAEVRADGDKRVVELPPVDKGDTVWCIGSAGGSVNIRSGKVSRLEIVDGRVFVYVHGVGSGLYGKRVFGTKEDAEAFLASKEGDHND